VVDIPDLLKALDDEQCGGAAIDVYEEEPPAEDDPIRSHPKVLCTPHLGASTAEAQEAVSTDACAQILEYLRGDGIRGAVNLGGVRLDLNVQQRRFVDLAERMARLIAPMCESGIKDIAVTIDGESLGSIASTIERMAVIQLLRSVLDVPVNLVNVKLIAEQRGISAKTTMRSEARTTPKIAIEIAGGERPRHILGSVFADGQPRVLKINGYHMDMIPEGSMIVLQNQDKPGMVGLVGNEMAKAELNIADMALSRRDDTALMVLKVDTMPTDAVLKQLRSQPGILKVVAVQMPPVENATP
jgi:D-3-phosphoglycerate dehydrogenase